MNIICSGRESDSAKAAGENLQKDVVQIRLVLLELRILVFLPLALIAAEEAQHDSTDDS